MGSKACHARPTNLADNIPLTDLLAGLDNDRSLYHVAHDSVYAAFMPDVRPATVTTFIVTAGVLDNAIGNREDRRTLRRCNIPCLHATPSDVVGFCASQMKRCNRQQPFAVLAC